MANDYTQTEKHFMAEETSKIGHWKKMSLLVVTFAYKVE